MIQLKIQTTIKAGTVYSIEKKYTHTMIYEIILPEQDNYLWKQI